MGRACRNPAFPADVDDFRCDLAAVEREPADRHRESEASWTRTPGGEIEHPVPCLARGPMRMPKDHRLIAGFSRIELDLQLGKIMQDEQPASFELDDLAIRELLGHAARFDVAAHGDQGRDGTELMQNLLLADIACMNDEVASRK